MEPQEGYHSDFKKILICSKVKAPDSHESSVTHTYGLIAKLLHKHEIKRYLLHVVYLSSGYKLILAQSDKHTYYT